MQIICPSCSTAYSVPEEKLVGRTVKCARCGMKWLPLSELPPQREAPPPPEPLPPREPLMIAADPQAPKAEAQWPFAGVTVPPPPPEQRSKGLLMAWVASIAFLLVVMASAYAKRDSVMQTWPPSQRVYGLFGLR